MSRLVDDVRVVLEGAGFATFAPRPDSLALQFEDISIIGLVHVLDTVDEILTKWQLIQDDFLRENASRFMRDTTKAWNLYTVLLTAEVPSHETAAWLFAIEDDFRGTRKIARAGVVSREDLTAALAPILPLSNVLAVGLVDAKQRLLERLAAVSPALRNLATGAPAEAIAASLLGNQ